MILSIVQQPFSVDFPVGGSEFSSAAIESAILTALRSGDDPSGAPSEYQVTVDALDVSSTLSVSGASAPLSAEALQALAGGLAESLSSYGVTASQVAVTLAGTDGGGSSGGSASGRRSLIDAPAYIYKVADLPRDAAVGSVAGAATAALSSGDSPVAQRLAQAGVQPLTLASGPPSVRARTSIVTPVRNTSSGAGSSSAASALANAVASGAMGASLQQNAGIVPQTLNVGEATVVLPPPLPPPLPPLPPPRPPPLAVRPPQPPVPPLPPLPPRAAAAGARGCARQPACFRGVSCRELTALESILLPAGSDDFVCGPCPGERRSTTTAAVCWINARNPTWNSDESHAPLLPTSPAAHHRRLRRGRENVHEDAVRIVWRGAVLKHDRMYRHAKRVCVRCATR